MGFIDDELLEVKRLCENVVEGSKLVSCVQIMVRVHIEFTETKRLVVCLQFPENYPNDNILIELKSKTLSEALLDKLTKLSEEESKKILGKPQILHVLRRLQVFLKENPLCSCYDEIFNIKKLLNIPVDKLKLKQKNSSLVLVARNDQYYYKGTICVPDNYPENSVTFVDSTTNFPTAIHKHVIAQVNEISRQCVEPPLRKNPKGPPFQVKPSLYKSVSFLIDCVRKLPNECCQYCDLNCFPQDPSMIVFDDQNRDHIERIYCGHLYHQKCLLAFMKTPPFGNKRCKACQTRISHHKWTLSDKLAENRWAHQEARSRELSEVEDFFK